MAGLELKIIEPQENEEDATEKQKAFIRALCSEVGASFPAATLNELGKWQASAIIEQLQSFKAELAGDKPLDKSRFSGIAWESDDDDSGSEAAPVRSSPSISLPSGSPFSPALLVVAVVVILLLLISLL